MCITKGADEGIRTPDLLITNQRLYQLSYISEQPKRGTTPKDAAPVGVFSCYTVPTPVKVLKTKAYSALVTTRVCPVTPSHRALNPGFSANRCL